MDVGVEGGDRKKGLGVVYVVVLCFYWVGLWIGYEGFIVVYWVIKYFGLIILIGVVWFGVGENLVFLVLKIGGVLVVF